MAKDETTRIRKTDQELLGELLKARVHAFQDPDAPASMPPRGLTCGECGTQMSESSEFCWMCGATRSSPPKITSDSSASPQTVAPGPVLHKFAPPGPVPSETASTGRFIPGDYSSAATAAAPRFDTVPGPQPVREPALFEHLYRQPQQELDEDEERPARKFDYRIAVLAVLLVAVVVLGYRQRHNASAFYALLRQTLTEQVAGVWEPKHPVPTERKSASSANENRTKPHARVRRPITKVPETEVAVSESKAEVRKPSFLRVRVEGQPSPELISNAPVPGAFMGDMIGSGMQVAHRSPTPPFAVTISPRESLSLLLKQVPPSYPPVAQASGVAGPVVLKALIHKDGNVGDLSVVTGSPLLTQSAMDAVRQWVYRPYYRNGEPTEVETLVVVDFPTAARSNVGKGPAN